MIPTTATPGKTRVHVAGRGAGVVEHLVTDPATGAIRSLSVRFDEGNTTCAFENDASIEVIAPLKIGITGWQSTANANEQVCYYLQGNGRWIAGRIDESGWMVCGVPTLASRGSYQNGRYTDRADGIAQIIRELEGMDVDTSPLLPAAG